VPRDTTVRQRVIEYLANHGPVEDKGGRATSRLKEAVGYAGGDAGFIRIVSLMAESGEVLRDVRGKRTYRISASEEAVASAPRRNPSPTASLGNGRGDDQVLLTSATGEFDYDELATALLVRVTRVLANETEDRGTDQAAWARRRMDQLEAKVVSLQRDLARARADVQAVTDERDALRGQLEAASHNIDVLTERLGTRQAPPRATERLDSEAQALLYNLRRPGPDAKPTRAG
jgi:hypothetical protein